jgi:hypothetical protein
MNTLESFKENNPQFADSRNDRWFGLLDNPDEETLSQLAFFLGSRFLWINGNAPDIPNPDGDTRIRTLAVFKSRLESATKETPEEIFRKVRLVHPEYGDRRNIPYFAQFGSSAKAIEAVQPNGALHGKLYTDAAYSSESDTLIRSFLEDNETRLGIQNSPYNASVIKNYLERQGPEVTFDLIDSTVRVLGRTDTKDAKGNYGHLNYHPAQQPAVIPEKKPIKRNPNENSHAAHSQRLDRKEVIAQMNPLLASDFLKANAQAKEEVERLINNYTVRTAVGTNWAKSAEAKEELKRIKIMSNGTVLNPKTGEHERVELFTEKLRKCREIINKFERAREKSR